jgi:hypothetical protein
MSRKKKKKRPAQQSSPMRWVFDPDIPTHDFFEGGSLDDAWNLQEAVESFVYMLEQGDFLTWEAVVCEEQGLPLTAQQRRALGSLISFNEEADDQILYLNEIPRPSEPWHVILNKIVPHLLMEPFRTFDMQEEVKSDGWHRIISALDEHGQGLSLPPGVASYREVVPAELRDKLWLQYCFDILGGLGQADDLTLEEEDPWRVDKFILRLRKCKGSVAHFGLTLASLLTRVILPERDRPLFVKLMQERLGLSSAQEQIADRL